MIHNISETMAALVGYWCNALLYSYCLLRMHLHFVKETITEYHYHNSARDYDSSVYSINCISHLRTKNAH